MGKILEGKKLKTNCELENLKLNQRTSLMFRAYCLDKNKTDLSESYCEERVSKIRCLWLIVVGKKTSSNYRKFIFSFMASGLKTLHNKKQNKRPTSSKCLFCCVD
jgi:hypothetical protein